MELQTALAYCAFIVMFERELADDAVPEQHRNNPRAHAAQLVREFADADITVKPISWLTTGEEAVIAAAVELDCTTIDEAVELLQAAYDNHGVAGRFAVVIALDSRQIPNNDWAVNPGINPARDLAWAIDPSTPEADVAEHVLRGLIEQGKPATVGGTCAYRAPDGCRCAVGLLIPDNLYTPTLECRGVSEVVHMLYGGPIESGRDRLLQALQIMHDVVGARDVDAKFTADSMMLTANDLGSSYVHAKKVIVEALIRIKGVAPNTAAVQAAALQLGGGMRVIALRDTPFGQGGIIELDEVDPPAQGEAQQSPSTMLADLFDHLRATGTKLPLSNSLCARLLHDALDEYVSPDDAPAVLETIDNLRADLDVLANALAIREQQS